MSNRFTIRRFHWWHEVVLAGLLVLVLAGAGWLDPVFLRPRTQLGLSTHVWELALIALPMMLVIVTAGIDLSVGSTMALSAVSLGLAYEAGLPVWPAAVVALAVGLAAGLLNGLFVAWVGVHPLIVTLATMAAYRGAATGISQARPISGFPQPFADTMAGAVLGIPVPGLIFAAAAAVTGVMLWRTPFGRSLYAIGHNDTAARFSGLPVARTRLLLHSLAGLAAGMAAVTYVARRNTAKADIGFGLELDVITAVVLGGTSIFGGRGTLVGTLLGIALIHEVREFVSWQWNRDELVFLVVGALLIFSVSLHKFIARKEH